LQRSFYLAQNRATATRGPEKGAVQSSGSDEAGIEFADEIQALIGRAGLDDYLDANPALPLRLHERTLWLAEHAYTSDDPAARHQLHKTLYFLYEDNLKPAGLSAAHNQFNPFLIRLRNTLERSWERFELGRIATDITQIPAEPAAFAAYFRSICAANPVVGHALFDFLAEKATRADLTNFFLSDAAVVVRFCDLVVLSMVGVDDEVRPELAENFWDEMGRGRFQDRHVHLYRDLLEYAGVNLAVEALDTDQFTAHLHWQGLAGYNLYLFLCLHRRNQFRSLGALGAAEMMDPAQYRKVLIGCRRVGLHDDERLAYYKGHEEVDVAHGDGWLENVLLPLVRKYPEARREIVHGAMMRFNITADYYDDLLARLSAGRHDNITSLVAPRVDSAAE